jgi:hypothetical protein
MAVLRSAPCPAEFSNSSPLLIEFRFFRSMQPSQVNSPYREKYARTELLKRLPEHSESIP